MRIVALAYEDTNEFVTLEIVSACYDDDYEGIKFVDTDDDNWYISNLSIETCNQICYELARRGFCDVTSYGEIQ